MLPELELPELELPELELPELELPELLPELPELELPLPLELPFPELELPFPELELPLPLELCSLLTPSWELHGCKQASSMRQGSSERKQAITNDRNL